MRIHVNHQTLYSYGQPVQLQPHVFRFRPRSSSFQRVLNFAMQISPKPIQQVEGLDLQGNEFLRAQFQGETDHLRVDVDFVVDTNRPDPSGYVLEEAAGTLPIDYASSPPADLAPYLAPITGSHQVRRFAQEVAGGSGMGTFEVLDRLTQRIYHDHEQIVRPTGGPWAPEHTLQGKQGSCRDLAVLMMECCRSLNIASRFVSGYSWVRDNRVVHELHAWAEAYLPGSGWCGFDPTRGTPVRGGHVAIAAAALPEEAAPVTGSFGSTNVTSNLFAEVRVRRVEEGTETVGPTP